MTVKQQKARSFRMLVTSLLRDSEVTPEARFLWMLIESYGDGNGSMSYPSLAELAEKSGRSREWVRRYIEELKEHEMIEIRKKKVPKGWVNMYHVFLRKP